MFITVISTVGMATEIENLVEAIRVSGLDIKMKKDSTYNSIINNCRKQNRNTNMIRFARVWVLKLRRLSLPKFSTRFTNIYHDTYI